MWNAIKTLYDVALKKSIQGWPCFHRLSEGRGSAPRSKAMRVLREALIQELSE